MLSAWVTGIAQAPPLPPCDQDSVVDHTPITVGMDTTPPPCYPFCTIVDSCHSVALDSGFSGVFELDNADEPFEIIVIDQCRWVVFDTCTVVRSTVPGFVLFNTFPPMSTVLICGMGNSQVTVFVKNTPSMGYPPFGPPILDLDTLCGPFTGIDEPMAGETTPEYTHYFTRASTKGYPTEPGVYIRSWPGDPLRPREKIVILH